MLSTITKSILFFALLLVFSLHEVGSQDHHWNSHADVAKKVKETFEKMDTYSASFNIVTTDGTSRKNMNGTLYYKKPGKIRFEFSSPAGDLIVSDGKLLWIYIHRLRAAGKQDLTLDKRDQDDSQVFLASPGPGISRLFSKYHYRFDTTQQPRSEDGGSYFVLDLAQRVKVGGFEKIKLYIDEKTYLIKKAVGTDSISRETTVVFSNQKVDPVLEGKIFQYQPEESVRIVLNPLVNE